MSPRPRVARIPRTCASCGTGFEALPSNIARGRGVYCSRPCQIQGAITGRPQPQRRAQMLAIQHLGATASALKTRKPKVPVPCEWCGTITEVAPCLVGRKRFCSTACKHAKRRTVRGHDHWLFTRVPRACELCGRVVLVKPAKLAEFRFCSRRCVGLYMAQHQPRVSSLETALEAELARRGLTCTPQHPIGPYTVDLALPEYRLALEADGTYWHASARQRAKDRGKDRYLQAHGWCVLRLPEVDIRADLTACGDRIAAAIMQTSPQLPLL